MTRTLVLISLVAATLCGCRGGGDEPAPEGRAWSPVLQDGLGDHRHPITTADPLAQAYFDQGLRLTFGFNHEGAVDAFHEAARRDPSCAMCFWGIALALGPNINAPMGEAAGRAAYEAVQQAQRLAPGASEAERASIAALAARYAADPAADRAALDLAYANAMREVHHAHPYDLDVATLFAESLMDLSPWDYWTPEGEPRPHTTEMVETLETVLASDPEHPGANHYLIHALEEHQPERAEAAADRLARIAPGAGHLVHMPSHIYWRVGRYEDAAEINERAVEADEAYFAFCRAPGAYAAGYYTHNLHFLWSAAVAEGRSDLALTTARRLAAAVPEEDLAEFPFLEDFLIVPTATLVRFGRWDAVLAEPAPPSSQRFVTAFWHYARGVAFARRGEVAQAEAEQRALDAAFADADLVALVYDVAGNTAGQRLEVARHHLEAAIARARGDQDAALAALNAAVRAQDAMNYIEPPAFYLPVRQALGASLLDAGRSPEAEAVYREDLAQLPRNGWSLYGLGASLRAQGRGADATWVERGYQNAWARADVELARSQF
jgi:tetratricopeptide (TPR) repeat protein